VREESSEWVMADLYGHKAGNGGHRQRMPTTHPELLYSECFPVYSPKSATGLR
jgi:hypothetical protein